MVIMNEIQNRISELENKGWSLAALADELGVTVNTVEKWKAGNTSPANSKATIVLFDEIAKKKLIPKKRRYAPGSRRSLSYVSSEVNMSDEQNVPAIFKFDGEEVKLRVDPSRETIWATQDAIANLFGIERSVVTKHIGNIFSEGELEEMNNVQKMHIDKSKKPVNSYTLDVILSVGYRVNSKIATKFRQWATQTLSEYIRDGAVLDETRLANNPNLQRKLAEKIRRIRTSEISLYAKVRDVFKESASDYNPEAQAAKTFFAMAQDKFHYAITQKTAAEIRLERAHPLKNNMGLVTFSGERPTFQEANVAKNYLTPDELRALENISEQFLLFAESKAFRGHKMTMEELSFKLNTLLTANDYPVLYEYKQYKKNEADEHVRKVFDSYQSQLKTPDAKWLTEGKQ